MKKLTILFITALIVQACTWVKSTELGEQVTLVQPFHVLHCQKKGQTQTHVKHEIGFFTRDEETVKEELITLAKNQAATMGADSIVAIGDVNKGNMTFEVYRCDKNNLNP